MRALVAGKDLQFHFGKDGVSFFLPEMQAYEVVGLEQSAEKATLT